jgi:hypothetical protein
MQMAERTAELLALSVTLHPAHDLIRRAQVATLAGRLGYATVIAPADLDPAELAQLQEYAGPARVQRDGVDAGPGMVRRADPELVRQARARVGAGGRVIVDVPVAIGRTHREAAARAARDPRFVGEAHPEHSGLFGTFERAQAVVLELARAGADELRATLADEIDLADLLAQARALVVGATATLRERTDATGSGPPPPVRFVTK